MNHRYSITAFAYNEATNIEATINSLRSAVNEQLDQITIIANGCTDDTAKVAQDALQKAGLPHQVISLTLGDKCNAWNTYVYEHMTGSDVQFFIDCDVQFSTNAFATLAAQLSRQPDKNAVTGLPLTGRNQKKYQELVTRYSCLFGNLYGLKREFLERLKTQEIKLPIGLCWIDAQLTKLVNDDLRPAKDDYQHRVTYVPKTGYHFDSLNPFKPEDIRLYINRVARYSAGQLQEPYLDALPFTDWPKTMGEINGSVLEHGVTLQGWKRILKNKVQMRLEKGRQL